MRMRGRLLLLINYSVASKTSLCFLTFYLPSNTQANQSQTLERCDLCATNQRKGNRSTEPTAPLWVDLLGHCRQQNSRRENKPTGQKHKIPGTLKTTQFLWGKRGAKPIRQNFLYNKDGRDIAFSQVTAVPSIFHRFTETRSKDISLTGRMKTELPSALSLTKYKASRKGEAREAKLCFIS